MKLYTLGTSHGGTEVGRSCSGNLLEVNGDYYLFDCGGDIERIMKDMDLPIGKIKAVFVSHMHGDHVTNLPAIAKCFTCGYSRMDTTLRIYLPDAEGLSAFKAWIKVMEMNPEHEKLIMDTFTEGKIYSDENVKISAIRTEHLCGGKKPSYAFVAEFSNGKRFLYTGDLNCDFHDYPKIAFETDFDLILSELVHFSIEKNLDTIIKSKTKKIVFTHLAPRNISVIESVKKRFPFEVTVAHDGMETDF